MGGGGCHIEAPLPMQKKLLSKSPALLGLKKQKLKICLSKRTR